MFSHPARLTAPRIPSGEDNAMVTGPPSRRAEIRTPMKVFVELCSFENVTYELAYTVDVSAHGARVLTKHPWQSNQHLTVRSVQGYLYSQARVAYCQSVDGRFFAIGVELRQPTADWTEPQKHSA
jgi:PilZ domain-containing protein